MDYSIFEDTMVNMNFMEIEKSAKNGYIVLLPISVMEEHGPHLCIGLHPYLCHMKCKLIKSKLRKMDINSIIAPPFYWGMSQATCRFPGSFTCRKETITLLIYDIIMSLSDFGFKYVFGVDEHKDLKHCTTMLDAFSIANKEINIKAKYILPTSALASNRLKGDESNILTFHQTNISRQNYNYISLHADDRQTALMYNYFPDLVDIDIASKLKPTNLEAKYVTDWLKGGDITKYLSPNGYVGDPASYKDAVGNFDDVVDAIAASIENEIKH